MSSEDQDQEYQEVSKEEWKEDPAEILRMTEDCPVVVKEEGEVRMVLSAPEITDEDLIFHD